MTLAMGRFLLYAALAQLFALAQAKHFHRHIMERREVYELYTRQANASQNTTSFRYLSNNTERMFHSARPMTDTDT